jgi:hypothetical protein
MGIGSTFITKRTAASAQDVIDQVEPQRPYEAAAPKVTSPGVITPSQIPVQAKRDSASAAAKVTSTERLGLR